MPRALKLISILIGSLLLLILVSAVVLPFVIDVNDYKPEIEKAVEEATGRDLDIRGDIDVSIFPWLGATIGEIRLGNAKGFGEQPFAELAGAEVHVKLLPLLSREIVVKQIVIESPVIRLQRKQDGEDNWSDLAGGEPAKETTGETSAPREIPDVNIGGIVMRDAQLEFADGISGQQLTLKSFTMETGAIRLPVDTDLSASGDFVVNEPQLSGAFNFDGRVSADLDTQNFAARDAVLNVDVSGDLPVSPVSSRIVWQEIAAHLGENKLDVNALRITAAGIVLDVNANVNNLTAAPSAHGRVSMNADNVQETVKQLGELVPNTISPSGPMNASFDYAFDHGKQTLQLSKILVQALGLDVGGTLNARGVLSEPVFDGELTLAEFSPNKLLSRLGMEPVQTSDDTVLEKAALKTRLTGTANSLSLKPIEITLDDSRITGWFGVSDIKQQAMRFDLALDVIDADRYLPPAAQADDSKTTDARPLDQIELPVEPVKGLNIDGEMRVGKLKAFGFNSNEVRAGIKALEGNVRVYPAEAKFYGGGYQGDIRYDVSGTLPFISLDEHVESVALGPLTKDLFGVDRISGTGAIDIAASAKGKTVGELRRDLDGKLGFVLKDGAVEGFNLWASIEEAYAKYKGRAYDKSNVPNRTRFASLSATGTLNNGVMHNDDLIADLPFLRVTGAGDIDLVQAVMDYRVNATFTKTPELRDGTLADELSGLSIPVRLKGPLTAPSVRPEVEDMLKARAKAELEKKKAELEAEAKAELERRKKAAEAEARRKLEEEKKRAEEKLKDKLKDLLN